MFKFQIILLALVLQQAVTSNSFLRSQLRRLSQEYFMGYEPITTVTDHAAIDQDQAAIEAQLALLTDQGRTAAQNIYTKGAFSKSYAQMTLTEPLKVAVAKGTSVVGRSANGNEVRGETSTDAQTGDSILRVEYHVGTAQATWTDCHVGGNPTPNTRGCFAATGSVEVGQIGQVGYSYSPLEQNFNGRTLQGFSTQAQAKMYTCATCPYATYKKFYNYYGLFDYGDQWVQSAFGKTSTKFTNGNAAFSNYGMEGTAEAIKKGTAYMNVWMYVIREMEDAIDDCNKGCDKDECNDDKVAAWDEAVAFYTGGIPKSSPDGGYLLYTLAQKRSANFGTAITSGSENGMAMVNSEIFKNFRQGKQDLLMGNCDDVRSTVQRISNLMAVPLIQGTIRYAYIIDIQNDIREKAEAEGATFAAAVLPLLHACSPADASTVYQNMRVGNGGSASFNAVKNAFEKNYKCLGITCADVGGLIDTVTGGYLKDAAPCTGTGGSSSVSNSSSESSDDGVNVGLAVGLSVGIFAFLVIVAFFVFRKRDQKEYDGAAEPEMAKEYNNNGDPDKNIDPTSVSVGAETS